MADIVTKQELENASIDAKDLGECVNGNETGIVSPRLGDPYPTLPAAIEKVENIGGYVSAATLTELNTRTPAYNFQLARVEETGDEYRWDPNATPAAKWVPTGKNWLNAAKAYADANPLFKPVVLTASDNLNSIKTDGIYKPGSGVPSLALNYPTTQLGSLTVFRISLSLAVQIYYTYSAGHWIRTTDAGGNYTNAWEQLGTKTLVENWANAITNKASDQTFDLNTITKNGCYFVYSTQPTSVTNHPIQGEQAFVVHYQVSNVARQIYYCRTTSDVYTRSLFGEYGWTKWVKLATTDYVDQKIATAKRFDPDLLDKNLRNPLKGSKIKFIGDSITWGTGASNVSPSDPRNGTLDDPRNTTNPISPTWANLFRQWVSKVYGGGTSIEDKPGSAYCQKSYYLTWNEYSDMFTMIDTNNIALTNARKKEIIGANNNVATGTVINFLSKSFPAANRPVEISFEIESDYCALRYTQWAVGDANDIVEVYVDDVLHSTFNYYDANTVNYDKEHGIQLGSYGKHKIKIVNKATNSASYTMLAGFRTLKKTWVVNEGIIGSDTSTWLGRSLFEGTLDGKDDYILMMLGTNDRAQVAGRLDGYRDRLRACIAKIKQLSPNSIIVLMSSTFAQNEPPTTYKFDMSVVDKVISEVARENNLLFISNYKACAQALIDGEAIWSDGLHLNDYGNKLYYQNIRKKLFEY